MRNTRDIVAAWVVPSIVTVPWVVFLGRYSAHRMSNFGAGDPGGATAALAALVGAAALVAVSAVLSLHERHRYAGALAFLIAAAPWLGGAASLAAQQPDIAHAMLRLSFGALVSQALLSGVAMVLAMRAVAGCRGSRAAWLLALIALGVAIVLGASHYFAAACFSGDRTMRALALGTPLVALVASAVAARMVLVPGRAALALASAMTAAAAMTAGILGVDWGASSHAVISFVWAHEMTGIELHLHRLATMLSENESDGVAAMVFLRSWGIALAWIPALVLGAIATWRRRPTVSVPALSTIVLVGMAPWAIHEAAAASLRAALHEVARPIARRVPDGFEPVRFRLGRMDGWTDPLLVAADGAVYLDHRWVSRSERPRWHMSSHLLPAAGSRWEAIAPLLIDLPDRQTVRLYFEVEEPAVVADALPYAMPVLRTGAGFVEVVVADPRDYVGPFVRVGSDGSVGPRERSHSSPHYDQYWFDWREPGPPSTVPALRISPECEIATALRRIEEASRGDSVVILTGPPNTPF